ncbi:hypothetical protein NONI108955_42440 [Nocardia ninae]|uniref:Uncharacterized protein n=1 Tax=Nocardia ninae NBRC 108245 TaxID=1210091 RepID=A0A511MTC3_9NOCA|nr:hypothetical protein NN4_83480 [Nocardia ninae NBRC 108245]
MTTDDTLRAPARIDHPARPVTAPALPMLAASSGSSPELASTTQFALITLLETRVRALVLDNRLLRAHLHHLTVALDDSLDRESAHSLCPLHERLVPSRTSFPPPLAYRSVSRCNRLTQPMRAATRSEVC